MKEVKSFCRICSGLCGVRLTIDDSERIVEVRGDKEHGMTAGFACIKGLQAHDIHHGPDRLLRQLKRRPDGSFETINLDQALDEIAAKLRVPY